jgi:hypothetical protein
VIFGDPLSFATGEAFIHLTHLTISILSFWANRMLEEGLESNVKARFDLMERVQTSHIHASCSITPPLFFDSYLNSQTEEVHATIRIVDPL